MYRFWLIIILFCFLVPAAGYGRATKHSTKEPIKRQLNEIKKQIKEKKEEIRISQKRAKQILDDIDKLDKQTNDINNKIDALNKEKTALIKEIDNTQKEIASLNEAIDKKKDVITKRLIADFKLHQTGYLQLLLASESPVDMEKRYTLLNYIIKHDEQEQRDYIKMQNALLREQQKYTQQKAQLDTITDSLNKQMSELVTAKQQKEKILASIRFSTEATRRVLMELQNSEEKLQDTLKSLESSSGSQIGFASMEGKLPSPVQGEMEKIFGKTTNNIIKSNGVLFRAKLNAPIRAVYPGIVVWSEWLKGYGNTIILDHGERYFTIYAHLSSIDVKVGDHVKADEIIGKLGNAGVGSDTTLYFEIRHGEKPLNPEIWLSKK
ncbi:MAG: murein hydrolase activator EnvC family protein [bacterium]